MRPERSDQRVLFVMRQAGEVGKLGHPELESWPPWSRQSPFDSAAYIPSTGGDEQILWRRPSARSTAPNVGRWRNSKLSRNTSEASDAACGNQLVRPLS